MLCAPGRSVGMRLCRVALKASVASSGPWRGLGAVWACYSAAATNAHVVPPSALALLAHSLARSEKGARLKSMRSRVARPPRPLRLRRVPATEVGVEALRRVPPRTQRLAVSLRERAQLHAS